MDKRFVSIWMPHLATDWFTLRKPELKPIPFVLCAPSHGRMLITAANQLAEKKGIHAGMALADAKAVFPALQHFDDKPGLIPQLLQRIAEWCIRFTPSAAVDPPGGIILDASGCTHLWGNDEAYITDIRKRLLARGYDSTAAIGDTIGAAWAAARFSHMKVIEEGRQAALLLGLPPEALRLDADTTERLYKLGLTKISDLVSIPRSALRRRFGPLIIQRLDQALGKDQEFIQPVYPAEAYQERLPCPEPILRAEGIELALERLLRQLCDRLQKEGKGLRQAYFRAYRCDSKTTGIQIETSRPSAHQQHLLHLFRMKIAVMEPEPGIELFVLEATRVEEHSPAQEAFWKEQGSGSDHRVSELVDRLSGRIGMNAIYRYLPDEHHWPERSFKKARSFDEVPSSGWKLHKPRPLQLLSPPERIEVTAPIPDYPPMHFRHKGKLHTILKADGPERIEQEWWIQEGAHRDYYAVEDEEGCRYWIFRLGHYDERGKAAWFLHGCFS